MGWFYASVASAMLLTGQSLAFQRLQPHYRIPIYLSYIWVGSALILAVIFLRPADFPIIGANLLPLVLAGLGSFTGLYCMNRAIRLQTNLGYLQAVSALRILITYVFSLVAWNATVDGTRLIGIVGIVLGVLAVAGAFTRKETAAPLPAPAVTDELAWLKWAFAAALVFSMMTICIRYATDGGVGPEVATVVVLGVAGCLFILTARYNSLSFRIASSHFRLMATAILIAAAGNAVNFVAFQSAPNLAYAIAIDNTRMILLYIIGLVMFAERLRPSKAAGIALTFAGVILLS